MQAQGGQKKAATEGRQQGQACHTMAQQEELRLDQGA
jgi:hypothetical protein